jgi:beta-lactamase regulating signal transducer with metallopeptidase domain/HEAT repeat protein
MKALISLIQPAFEWTWKNSLQVALLVGLVLLVQTVLARWLTPRLRYALSLLILLRLLLPAVPSSPLSLENLFRPAARLEVHSRAPERGRLGEASLPEAALSDGPVNPMVAEPVPVVPATPLPFVTPFVSAPPSRLLALSAAEVLGLAWACGLLALVSLAAWRYAQWCRLIRHGRRLSDPRLLALLDEAREAMGVRRPVTLVAMARIGSPAVFGFRRVRLLLPETMLDQLTDQDLHLLFLHEMAHVRRHDMLLNLLLMAVQFVHWFNPLVWLGLHRLRADRELVCDAMVLQRTKPEERLGYGTLLLKLLTDFPAAQAIVPTAVPVVSSKRELKRRILSIKYHRRSGLAACLATGLVAVGLVCATFTGSSQQSPAVSDPPAGEAIPKSSAADKPVEQTRFYRLRSPEQASPAQREGTNNVTTGFAGLDRAITSQFKGRRYLIDHEHNLVVAQGTPEQLDVMENIIRDSGFAATLTPQESAEISATRLPAFIPEATGGPMNSSATNAPSGAGIRYNLGKTNSRMVETLEQEVTVRLDNVPLEGLMANLSTNWGVNIVADKSLRALTNRLSVNLDQVELLDLFRYLARNYSLQFQVGDEVVWVVDAKDEKRRLPPGTNAPPERGQESAAVLQALVQAILTGDSAGLEKEGLGFKFQTENSQEMLDFSKQLNRWQAATALTKRGTNAWPVVPALLSTVTNKDMSVGHAAAEALVGIKAEESPEWARSRQPLTGQTNAARVFRYLVVGRDMSGKTYDGAHRRFGLVGLAATGPAAGIAYADIVDALKHDKEPEVRACAAMALGGLETERKATVVLLKGVLQDKEEWPLVSAAAAKALVTAAPAEAETRDLLRQALQDQRSAVRLAAARALWRMKAPPEELLPVLTALLSHKLASTRAGALNGLSEMGSAARPSVSEVQRLTADENESVRRAAAEALKNITQQAQPGATKVSQAASTPEAINRAALNYLDSAPEAKGREPSPLYVRTFKVDTNAFLSGLRNSEPPDGIVVGRGIEASPRIPSPSPSDWELVPSATLTPDSPRFRISGLHLVDGTAVSALVINHLARRGVDLDPKRNPGKAVFYNDREGVLLVRATLQDLDIVERVIAELNSTPSGGPSGVPKTNPGHSTTNAPQSSVLIQGRPIADWVKEAEISVRPGKEGERALRVLENAGPPIMPQLARLLVEDKSPEIQAKAAWATSVIGYHNPDAPEVHSAVPVLTTAAQSKHQEVRIYSVQALGAIGRAASNAVPVLIRLTRDENDGVRMSAVEALGRIGAPAPDSIAALTAAASDASSDVRITARKALIVAQGGKASPLMTSDEAGSLAEHLANEKAQALYNCQPFRKGPPARFVRDHWAWHHLQAQGLGDIEATVEFAADGAEPKVTVVRLESVPRTP